MIPPLRFVQHPPRYAQQHRGGFAPWAQKRRQVLHQEAGESFPGQFAPKRIRPDARIIRHASGQILRQRRLHAGHAGKPRFFRLSQAAHQPARRPVHPLPQKGTAALQS